MIMVYLLSKQSRAEHSRLDQTSREFLGRQRLCHHPRDTPHSPLPKDEQIERVMACWFE